MAHNTSLSIDNYIKIMAEYTVEPVWDRDNLPLELADLPISPELQQELIKFNDEFEMQPSANQYYFNTLKELQEWSARGAILARKLKQELPLWTIIYYDYGRYYGVDKDTCDYEIEL